MIYISYFMRSPSDRQPIKLCPVLVDQKRTTYVPTKSVREAPMGLDPSQTRRRDVRDKLVGNVYNLFSQMIFIYLKSNGLKT